MFLRLRTATLGAGIRMLAVAGLCSITLLAGRASAAVLTIDPDTAASDQNISAFFAPQGVTLSSDGADPNVYAVDYGAGKTFGWLNQGFTDQHWARPESPNLLADFGFLARSVSIDYETESSVTLFAYGDTNNLLGSTTVSDFAGTVTFSAANDSIRRVVVDLAPRAGADFGALDNLVIETDGPTAVPEPNTMALFAVAALPLASLLRRRKA